MPCSESLRAFDGRTVVGVAAKSSFEQIVRVTWAVVVIIRAVLQIASGAKSRLELGDFSVAVSLDLEHPCEWQNPVRCMLLQIFVPGSVFGQLVDFFLCCDEELLSVWGCLT